jgi:hypothetical protein
MLHHPAEGDVTMERCEIAADCMQNFAATPSSVAQVIDVKALSLARNVLISSHHQEGNSGFDRMYNVSSAFKGLLV